MLDISNYQLIGSVIAIFLAAIVRGFAGFGFSLLAISMMSLFIAPATIIPSMFLLEIAASLNQLPSIWRDIDWRSLRPLIIGCLVGTPLGVYLLAMFPPLPLQLGLGIFVLVTTMLMWKGFRLKHMPSSAATFVAGAASGFANGSVGIGGPPAILFYFSSPAAATASRASLIAYFLCTDVIGLPMLYKAGLVTGSTLLKAAIFLPFLLAGIWFGARSFKSVDPAKFRKIVLGILAVLALLILAKASYQMFA